MVLDAFLMAETEPVDSGEIHLRYPTAAAQPPY